MHSITDRFSQNMIVIFEVKCLIFHHCLMLLVAIMMMNVVVRSIIYHQAPYIELNDSRIVRNGP